MSIQTSTSAGPSAAAATGIEVQKDLSSGDSLQWFVLLIAVLLIFHSLVALG